MTALGLVALLVILTVVDPLKGWWWAAALLLGVGMLGVAGLILALGGGRMVL